MVTLNAHFDGKAIVPDEPLALAPNQKLRVTIETIDPLPTPSSGKPGRVLGQQKDAVLYLAPDFNEALGDDFWLGESK